MAKMKVSKEGHLILSQLTKITNSFKINKDYVYVTGGNYGMGLYTYPTENDEIIKSDETIGLRNVSEFLNLIGEEEIEYTKSGSYINLKKGKLSVRYGIDNEYLSDKNDKVIDTIKSSEKILSFKLSQDTITELLNIQKLLKLPSMKITKKDGVYTLTPFNPNFPDENQSSMELDNIEEGTGFATDEALLMPSRDKKSMLDMLILADYKVTVVKADIYYIIFEADLDPETQGDLMYIFVLEEIIE